MARPRKDGTPSKYDPYNGGVPKKYTDEWIENEAKILLEWISDDNPKKVYLGTFAFERGYDRQRLSEFANSNKTFADAYRHAKVWQEQKFVGNGLTKTWDPSFTMNVMARVCNPEWKKSWDQPEERAETQVNISINKI